MSFLALTGASGGTPLVIRVATDGGQEKYNYHHRDFARMFDGTYRETRLGVFREWDITTNCYSEADARALIALLKTNDLPLIATGDLVGDNPVFVMPTIVSNNPTASRNPYYVRRVSFKLDENPTPFQVDSNAFFDFDADNATTTPTFFNGFHDGGGDYNYDGVLGVANSVAGGPNLLPQTSELAGWYGGQAEINGHSFVRAWGSSNNNPYISTLSSPRTGLPGLTILTVSRPGHGVNHGPGIFILKNGSGFLLGLGSPGVASEPGIIGGWRRGAALGETGEIGATWGGVTVSETEAYDGEGPSDVQTVSRGLGTTPSGPFTIAAVRINAAGQVTFFKSGVQLELAFTSDLVSPITCDNLLVTSSAGGSLDLGGGQAWDWTRIIAYPLDLLDSDILDASNELALRYGLSL